MSIIDITSDIHYDKTQRLAAYCRVSSDSDDQLHSFAVQYRHYADYEKHHPEVRLVDIYADEGISGTSLINRDEMNRLISDCEQGSVAINDEDLIDELANLQMLLLSNPEMIIETTQDNRSKEPIYHFYLSFVYSRLC